MKFLILLTLFSQLVFAEKVTKEKPLSGWTIFSKDPRFDTSSMEKLGVKKRKNVIEKMKKRPGKTYVFDICDSLIKKHFEDIKFSNDEKKELCDRSLNVVDYLFISIYRNKVSEAKLKKFRQGMREKFN